MDELIQYAPALAAGFLENIKLALMCAVLSLIIGTIVVSMRVSPTPVLRTVGTTYVTIVRNTPLTLILAFSALGLSDTLGVTLSDQPSTNSFWLVVLGLSAYTAAFVAEALRAGVNTIPLGQAEAARAVGLTFFQSLSFDHPPAGLPRGDRSARQRDDRDDQEHHGGDRRRVPCGVRVRHEGHLR